MKYIIINALFALFFSTHAFSLVENFDFEMWSGDTPHAWTTIDSGLDVRLSEDIANSGSRSAAISVNSRRQSATDFRQSLSVIGGEDYEFSVWVYHTEGGLRSRLYVDGYRGYSDPKLVNQWQKITYQFNVSQDATIEVGLRFYALNRFDGAEVVYIDTFNPGLGSEPSLPPQSCKENRATLNLLSDNYGSETRWEVLNSQSTVLYSGSDYSSDQSVSELFCLSDGTYTFTIYDSFGDGLCCRYGQGSYAIVSQGKTLLSGGEFADRKTHTFSLGASGGASGLNEYYKSAEGLRAYALKTALHNIIKNHNSRGYSALWTFYRHNDLDHYYENDGSILDIYSERPGENDLHKYTKVSDQCGSYSREGDCYNREHAFPKSWFAGAVEPMNSDVHHVFPSDGYVNARRGNYPYGQVGSAAFSSNNGSKVGGASSSLGYLGTVFEPINEFKGGLARAYFYMATRYENIIANWNDNNTSSDAVLNGSADQVFEPWMLVLLKSWHRLDPVSQKERDRNDAAFRFQNNRNPYVDHPEFVELIWGI